MNICEVFTTRVLSSSLRSEGMLIYRVRTRFYLQVFNSAGSVYLLMNFI